MAACNNADANTLQQILAVMLSTSNPNSVTAAQVGLGNANNTSDANKPISTAMQTALNGLQSQITTLSALIPPQPDWNAVSGLGVILNKPTIPSSAITASPISVSLVTSTSAGGTQVSSTKNAFVNFTVSDSTTATIGGASTSDVILERCATNSTTASDWKEVDRFEEDQTITLAVALQSTAVQKGELYGYIAAGSFFRLRNVGTGTHSEAIIDGEAIIFG